MRVAQERILRKLVNDLAVLPVGVARGLDRLPRDHRLVEAFRERIAVSETEDYRALIARVATGERDVMFAGRTIALAQTSGTTSSGAVGERYIPQNKGLLDHHARGGAAALTRLIRATGLGMLDGQLLMLGGSTDLDPNPHGIPVGDLSGITAMRIPAWLRGFYEPGLDIALERDWERKLTRIAERCAHRDIRLVSGIPSWCLMLFQRICAERNLSRLRVAWPHLQGFIHGGHAIGPFIPGLREHLPSDCQLMEVYPASEAFIAVGSRPWRLDEGVPPPLDLLADHGVVLEFAPEDGGPVVGPDGIADGGLYRVLVTTPGGLIRYQVGDLVQGVEPGRVRFAGRVRTRMSAFGEHVEGVHLDEALCAACRETGARVAHYHVAPRLPDATHAAGAHDWLVEFERKPADIDRFAAVLDDHLTASVIDYAAHRAGHQLDAPQVSVLPTGTFHRYLAAVGKMGGQHKVPQAWNDRVIADALQEAVRKSGSPEVRKSTADVS
jgi:hypothetical protein